MICAIANRIVEKQIILSAALNLATSFSSRAILAGITTFRVAIKQLHLRGAFGLTPSQEESQYFAHSLQSTFSQFSNRLALVVSTVISSVSQFFSVPKKHNPKYKDCDAIDNIKHLPLTPCTC
jgi:hypothetical protein